MKKAMKKLAAAMIAMVAVIAVVGTSVPTEAAAKAPRKITLKATSSTVDIKGKTTVSVKSVTPASASKAVTYKSSNTKVATVSSKGVVTGKKAGKVTITVTSKSNKKVKATKKITVKNLKPTSLTLSSSKATLNIGAKKTIKATVKPAGVYCPVSYTSSNKSVATVSSTGVVTAKKPGTATITVKTRQKNSRGKYLTKTCKVTVNRVEATTEEVVSYMNDTDENTVLIDAREADAYQGWALGEAKRGGHLKNAVNISAQWLDCSYWSNKKENKTREESIQKELDANGIITCKKYIIYDTNGKDAIAIKNYLTKYGYQNILVYNATDLINSEDTELVSYANYDMYVPAEIVKNISDHVVSNAELNSQAAAMVDGDPIVLLDVSWGDETNDPNTGSGYEDGHVPGTVHVNTDEYETPAVYVPEKDEDYRSEWRLNSDADLLKLAADKGITKDSCVVITGYEPLATTRMGIILKYLGCENVHVMSEGTVGWDAKGYDYETGINKPVAVESFGVTEPQNPDLIDTIDEAADKLANDPDYQLIDTRTEEEWNGTSSGYGYHDLAGRIAGTIHSPSGIGYSSSMYYYRNPDKSMRSKEVLEAMWKEQEIDTSKHMAFFCGSGWRAAEEAWDAMLLGYDKVSLYSDGWIGWSNEGNPYIDKDGNEVYYDKTKNQVVSVYNYISADDLMTDLAGERTYKLLDVRKAADYATAHVAGAVSADVDAVVSGTDEATAAANVKAAIEGDSADTKYAVICYSGNRYAKAATKILKAAGVDNENIFTLQGGMKSWNEKYENYNVKSYTSTGNFNFTNGVTAEQVKADVEAENSVFTVFDLRTAVENAAGHIEGAVSTPLRVMGADASINDLSDEEGKANLKAAVETDPKGLYVLECYSGNKYANKAVGYLKELGVKEEQIIVLEGGASGWKNAGYATVKSGTASVIVDKDAKSVTVFGVLNGTYLEEPTKHYMSTTGFSLGNQCLFEGLCDRLDLAKELEALGATPWNTTPGGHKITSGEYITPENGDNADYTHVDVNVTWTGNATPVSMADTLKTVDGSELVVDQVFSNNKDVAASYKSGCLLCTCSCYAGVTTNAGMPFVSGADVKTMGNAENLPAAGTIVAVTITLK